MSGQKWLVAGDAAYRVVASDAATVRAVVEGGTADPRVLGREVSFTRDEIRANVAAGVLRIVDVAPRSAQKAALAMGAAQRKGKR